MKEKQIDTIRKKGGNGSILTVGVVTFGLIMCIIALILSSFEYQFFSTWVVFVFMCSVPTQLVITMQMETDYPDYISRMSQPGKGIVMTLFTAGIAAIVAFLLFHTVGQGIGPPTPMLINYMIMTVVVTFWVIPVMESWPFSVLTSNPVLLGIVSLTFSYSLALGLFRLFFDFSFMSTETFYTESLDPRGLLNAWTAISFFVTVNAAMLVLLLTRMTLVSRLLKSQKQPVLGIIVTIFVLFISFVCSELFVKVLGMDKVIYMVRVPVCFIFGVFLVDPLMQHKAFERLDQPLRGLCLSLVAATLAVFVYYGYAAVGPILVGIPLSAGAPAYQLELWIANALLGITFPVIVIMAKYFDFWPLKLR